MRRMAEGRSLCLLVALVAVGVAVSDAGAQSDTGYIFRSTVGEVRLTIVATDQHKRRVATLAPSDLAIVDNESIIRQFRSFTRSTVLRLKVVVLVDCSGSVAPRFASEIRNVLQVVSNADWGPVDTVSVLSFCGSKPQFICSKDCRGDVGMERIANLKPEGLTPLFDAVVYAAGTLAAEQDPTSKSVLVVFSDGNDTISHGSVAVAIRGAQQADAVIYTVDSNKRRAGAMGTYALESMANATGGLNLSLDDGVPKAFATVLEDLRSGYVLTYAPPRSAQPEHWVRVLPTRDLNLTFRSRQGYLAAAN